MKKKITAFALLFVLLFISINIPTEAATTPSYYYLDGENHFVTKRNVTYEGTSIDLTETPALVIDGYNYVPVADIQHFQPHRFLYLFFQENYSDIWQQNIGHDSGFHFSHIERINNHFDKFTACFKVQFQWK